MMMNMNTSPPRKAQSKGDKTLRDLSKRGLVMKSPFFTMFSDNSKNNDNNDSSNQSTNDKKSSLSKFNRQSVLVEKGVKNFSQNNNNHNTNSSSLTTSDSDSSISSIQSAPRMTMDEDRDDRLENEDKQEELMMKESIENQGQAKIQEAEPLIQVESREVKQLELGLIDNRLSVIAESIGEKSVKDGLENAKGNRSSTATEEDESAIKDTEIVKRDNTAKLRDVTSYYPKDGDETVQVPPPPLPPLEDGKFVMATDVMSRQSVLDAFENDIRDLLLLEESSNYTDLKFDQERERLSQLTIQEEDEEPVTTITATSTTAAAAAATSTTTSTIIASINDKGRALSTSSTTTHYRNDSTVNNSMANSPTHFRYSRSTISSYGGQETSEFVDPEDPKSQVPADTHKSHKSLGSNISSTSSSSHVMDRPRSMSANVSAPQANHIPPVPSVPATPMSSTFSPTTSITSPKDNKDRKERKGSVDGGGMQAFRRLSRMSSDLDQKIKRGRLSLRRKSTMTLQLPSSSLLGNDDESLPPPTPSLQMLTATYESFLHNTDPKLGLKAHVPVLSSISGDHSQHELIPLWFLRQILKSKSHTPGAYLSNRFFIPSDMWQLQTINPKVLDVRLKCLNDLTKIGADLTANEQINLIQDLDVLENTFNSAFYTPFNNPAPDTLSPTVTNNSSSTATSSSTPPVLRQRRSSLALSIMPSISFSTNSSNNNNHNNNNNLTPITTNGTLMNTTTANTNNSNTNHHAPTSRASGIFKRLRKKSLAMPVTTSSNITPPNSEPPTPTTLVEDIHKLSLDNYLSSISSLAAALESVQETNKVHAKTYRCFVAHVACRLILKDIIALQDIYKSDFREYLAK